MPHMPAPPSLAELLASTEPFALLDDARAPAGQARSRLLHGFTGVLACASVEDLPAWQAQLQAVIDAGQHVLLLADYQWGLELHDLPPSACEHDGAAGLRALLFAQQQLLDTTEVAQWLATPGPTRCGLLGWRPAHDRQRFIQSIARIHAAIRRGDTYQVNHTFALEGLAHGNPAAIHAQLRQRQPAAFGALIRLPQQHWVLSLSPELFVRVDDGVVSAQPMKGTVAAGDNPAEAAHWLATDGKNRAENLMIVDLLRNDLARIAEPGTVQVPALFQVQPVGRVLGMTSTIQARLAPQTDLATLLQAVFPCGSITGAPKRSTMALIQQLETASPQPHARGLYTGAIGWLQGGTDAARMQLCLSVPIRTIELSPHPGGGHYARLPVGAGITIDSDAASEWDECLLKGDFACRDMAGLSLFETMRVDAQGKVLSWPAHRARLLASARQLSLPLDPNTLDQAFNQQQGRLAAGPPRRLRLSLAADGRLDWHCSVLEPLPGTGPVTLLLSPSPIDTPHWLLAHKTDLRQQYDQAIATATAAGAFDMLFFNAQGQLTEGARSNVFVKLAGHWYTPPVAAGLLPGVMRGQLLADPTLKARERTITRDELLAAQELLVCNALRGALPAVLAH